MSYAGIAGGSCSTHACALRPERRDLLRALLCLRPQPPRHGRYRPRHPVVVRYVLLHARQPAWRLTPSQSTLPPLASEAKTGVDLSGRSYRHHAFDGVEDDSTSLRSGIAGEAISVGIGQGAVNGKPPFSWPGRSRGYRLRRSCYTVRICVFPQRGSFG